MDIIVDCSTTKGNPGFTEYRGLNLETGELLFEKEVGMATNNIGEWLAIVHAIHYLKDKGIKGCVWSDSKIAISWAIKKICKTNIFEHYPALAKQNQNLQSFISEALAELRSAPYTEIRFWDKWKEGKENPADYNRK